MSNKAVFKNFVIFNIKDVKEEDINKITKMKNLKELSSKLTENKGFTNYLYGSNEVVQKVNKKFFFLKFKEEKKDVPNSVVNEILKEKELAYFQENGKPLSSKEKKAIKEEIIHSLLPNAFIKTSYTEGYIDLKNNYLVLNVSGMSKAEKFIAELKQHFDFSFSIVEPNIPLSDIMTNWVKENKIPDPFAIEDFCSLYDPVSAGTTDYKKQHIEEKNEELLKNLENGKVVKSIKINWHERISFVLTDQLIVKSISYSDSFEENINENLGESSDEYALFNATMTILCEDIAELFQDLINLSKE